MRQKYFPRFDNVFPLQRKLCLGLKIFMRGSSSSWSTRTLAQDTALIQFFFQFLRIGHILYNQFVDIKRLECVFFDKVRRQMGINYYILYYYVFRWCYGCICVLVLREVLNNMLIFLSQSIMYFFNEFLSGTLLKRLRNKKLIRFDVLICG